MMTGHRNVCQEESFVGGQRIDPRKHSFYRGWLVHTETGIHIATNVAGVFQRTRAQGMVVGVGDRGCRMDYVSDLEDVAVGDVVITSGLDEIYPKGLTIGVVSSVEEGDQLTKNISIRPEVDFHQLEEVVVLLTEPQESARAGMTP